MVNFKTLAIIALSAATNACMTDYDASYRFQVTSDFTDAQYAIMQAEADHLCEINNGRCVELTREEWPNKIKVADLGGKVAGMLRVRSDGLETVFLDDYVVEMGYLGQVFRHELGHAAGCRSPNGGHLTEEGNVMHDDPHTISPDIEWTDADLACINRAWD